MRHFSFIKLFALSAILFTAMAFSCEDHQVPEPTLNCSLLDGSPRAFPCEFEFVKIEFFNQDTDEVVATATPTDTTITLPRYTAAYVWPSGIFEIGETAFWHTRITVRRIANASFPNADEYMVRDLSPDFDDDTKIPISPSDGAFQKQKINVAVGETFTIVRTVQSYYLFDKVFTKNTHLALQNLVTSAALRGAPYNYTNYRNMAEARISLNLVHTYY